MEVLELPLPGLTVSHAALLVAVHAAAGEIVRVKVELPAAGVTAAEEGVNVTAL